MKNKWQLFFLLLLISVPAVLFAADKLIFAVDVIRHGDRTPGQILPTVDYKWKEGLEQLTARGMKQEYELGAKFRKRYVDETHLLPEHYQHGTIYVRSTDYERTLMSAQSCMMGLYPPGTGPDAALPYAFQAVPIFSAPYKYDEVISKYVDDAEEDKLMQRYVYSTPEWQQKNKELQPQYARWSRLIGIDIKSLEDLDDIGDTLYIYQINHAPMPKGLSDEDIKTIIDTSNWVFLAEQTPTPVAVVYSTQIMTNIGNYLKNGSDDSSQLKYVLLSAHDDTIISALSYIGVVLKVSPPFASDLNFSLYESGPNYYTVKVTYNDSLVFIPGCNGTVCELNQFLKLINDKHLWF